MSNADIRKNLGNGKSFGAIVVGLGGMGSAAAYHLAKRGVSVAGIEQFEPAHAQGSSHGESRIIRQAYYEDPSYVPILRRAYALWDELQSTTDEPIWKLTGGLTVGLPDAPIVAGVLESSRQYGVPIESLDAPAARQRFPSSLIRDDEVALYEPTVGALFPERCVQAHLRGSARLGAVLRFGERIASWQADHGHAVVKLTSDETLEAERLVICAGPWLNEVADNYWPIRIERNVQHWFAPSDASSAADIPIFMVQRRDFPYMFYGFPDFGGGLKVAFHHSDDYISAPIQLKRDVEGPEIALAQEAVRSWLGELVMDHVRSVPCMYSMSPDEHFIIGAHPEHESVIVAGGFSGHGFKFCSVVGEIIADIVASGKTESPIELFATDRFVRS